ncbi:MAG: proton-conducting transporter membrane subunit, partial [Nevskia sp.]|nr:proton-conducting transporter membrane subunit [Nevskia sp.]
MNRQQLLALLPILITSATVVWVMTAIAIKRHHWWNATFSVVGLNLALFGCVVAYLVSPQIVTPLLIVDSYSCLYMAMVLATGLATATLSHAYMEGYDGNKEEVYLLLNLSVLGGLVLVCARHFASFFIGLELLSVPLYGLIGYLVKERRSLEASMKYLVLSAAASAFILFGMALIYSQTGALAFSDIGTAVATITGSGYTVMVVGGAMILVGIGFKLSLAPFHLWTPDVYEGAPAPVAAYLATASKVAVFAVLLRFFIEARAYNYELLLDVLTALAIVSIVLG